MRYRHFAVFLLSVVLAGVFFASGVSAQEGIDPDLPTGDRGWCETGSPADQCGFESAEAACQFQVNVNYETGKYKLADVTYSQDNRAHCSVYRDWSVDSSELYIGEGSANRRCNTGYTRVGNVCTFVSLATPCETCPGTGGKMPTVGNPIDLLNGAKRTTQVDFQTADGRLSLKRHYNSLPYGTIESMRESRRMLGDNWQVARLPILRLDRYYALDWSMYLSMPNGTAAKIVENDDLGLRFTAFNAGANYPSYRAEFVDGLEVGPSGIPRKVMIKHIDGLRYYFDTPQNDLRETGEAVLTHIIHLDGYRQDYNYYPDGRLHTIVDSFGRTLTFEYNTVTWHKFDMAGNVLQLLYNRDGTVKSDTITTLDKVIFPDGTAIKYSYDSVTEFERFWDSGRRLVAATKYKVSTEEVIEFELYHYDDPRFDYALTGITDEDDIRYASWTYDEIGRANSSEHAGGVDRYDVDYGTNINGNYRTRIYVTNPLGRVSEYEIDEAIKKYRLLNIRSEATTNVPADIESFGYNGSRDINSEKDKEDRYTNYVRDGWGREIVKTHAAGTSEQYTTTKSYHPEFGTITQTVEPGLTTDYSYNSTGQLTDMVQTDTSANSAPARVSQFGWGASNMIRINGPLDGTEDLIRFDYNGEKLTSVTNELGHITQITGHNPIGAPANLIDPNGVTTQLLYDDLHRLTHIRRAGAETVISYSPTDLVTSVVLPNNSRLVFIYDDARRLQEIVNGENERIEYFRNAMGGITQTYVLDSSGTTQYAMADAHDEINRVIEATGVNSITKFDYDREDNLTKITDPRNKDWTQTFDNLDRLKSELNPLGGTTDYQLDNLSDSRNPLTGVTDPRGVTTTYVRNGFGEVIREISFETGTTEYERDAAGRIIKMTDARGVVSDYVYDGADRLLSVSYPSSPADDITYDYDQGLYGIGELTTVTESFGATSYGYDNLGHMTAMSRTINGLSYDYVYEYDLAGEVIAITYPSGRRIAFTRDLAARVTSIAMSAPDGTVTTLADGIAYKPFGPLSAMSLGDGHDLSINYDANYRATKFLRTGAAGSIMDLDFTYDPAGDITALNDNIHPDRSQGFGYDALSRLTTAYGGYGSINYDYNAGGDRTARDWSKLDGTLQSESYTYDSATVRLLSVSAMDGTGAVTPIRDFAYAPSGQMTSDTRAGDVSSNIYSYGINARGRMTTVTLRGSQVAAYTYDESEQRIIKTAANQTTHYHYDLEGRLIAETNGVTGETIREYVWLGLMPVAVIAPGAIVTGPEGECDQALIDELTAELSAAQSAAEGINAQINDHAGTRVFREGKIAEMEAQLENLSGHKRDKLAEKIANWQDKILKLDVKIDELTAELDIIQAEISDIEAALATAQANCDPAPPPSLGAGTFYLHADHLGRPQYATDDTGAIVWDMGGEVTPFGEGVNMAGAFAQQLMFPGQYADEETGQDITLSHNWHRTYDPTLGRYLQSDPIGLASGLNRYAYVGGNPVSWVDPQGLYKFTPEFWVEYGRYAKGHIIDPRKKNPLGNLATVGLVIGGLIAVVEFDLKYDLKNDDCDDDDDRCRRRKNLCIQLCTDLVFTSRAAKPWQKRDLHRRCQLQCMFDGNCDPSNNFPGGWDAPFYYWASTRPWMNF